jgi:hypothetical protein
MPDWRARIRQRLAGSGLSPTVEIDVVEELAQHVEDRFRALSAEGVDERAAVELSLREIDGPDLAAALRHALQRA